MPSLRHTGLTAALMVLALAAPAARAMGVLPNCLDDLRGRTSTWSVCTHEYSRTARECGQATANMWSTMQTCERKGFSKQQIDAAMEEGAANAGKKTPQKPSTAPVAPSPRPKSGPIPGLNPPRPDSGN